MTPDGRRLRILHVWANPRLLTETAADVQAGRLRLLSQRFSSTIQYEDQPACSREDLLARLNAFRPHVLHVSGHGDPSGTIALMHSDSGLRSDLSKPELASLLRDRPELGLLVLDCCYGLVGVEALEGSVRAVIAARDRLQEPYPIAFSMALYDSLASGRSLRAAWQDASVVAAEHGGARTDLFELWCPGENASLLDLVPGRSSGNEPLARGLRSVGAGSMAAILWTCAMAGVLGGIAGMQAAKWSGSVHAAGTAPRSIRAADPLLLEVGAGVRIRLRARADRDELRIRVSGPDGAIVQERRCLGACDLEIAGSE
jgi:hypothetical protein